MAKFIAGQLAEYGTPSEYALGGAWSVCRIIAVDARGRPTKIQAHRYRKPDEWCEPHAPLPRDVFRVVPKDPWVLRRKEPDTYPNGSSHYTYFVQVPRRLPFLQIGALDEAYRFANERDARKALAVLGDRRMLALRVATTERDEAALSEDRAVAS